MTAISVLQDVSIMRKAVDKEAWSNNTKKEANNLCILAANKKTKIIKQDILHLSFRNKLFHSFSFNF